jgi:transcription-repair coupling factor (superfamily II helicase)
MSAAAPTFDPIARKTAATASFEEVVARLQQGALRVDLHGIPRTLAAFLVTHVQRSVPRPLLVVAPDEERAEQWRDDLQAIAGEQVVRYFPAWDVGLYDGRSPSREISGLRIEALDCLRRKRPAIIVAPATALVTPVIPPHALELGMLTLKLGSEYPLDQLASHLIDVGFERVPMVDAVGQFSIRGGIVDISPVGVDHPLRLEFFGDEIESIREFDLSTQRSVGSVEAIEILPAGELLLNPPFFQDYAAAVNAASQEAGIELRELKDQLELGGSLDGIEVYMAILYGRDNGLFEYLEQPILFCDDETEIAAELENALLPSQKEYERHADRKTHLPPDHLVRDHAWLEQQINQRSRLVSNLLSPAEDAIRFEAREPQIVHGELPILRQEITKLASQGFEIHVLSETQGQRTRLEEILSDWNTTVEFGLGALQRGFVFPEAKVALYNDHEIFSRQKQRYRYRRFKEAKPISGFQALHLGDFVVHVDHGIGRYRGIRRLELGGRDHDCLEICYQGDDKLFIPVEQLNRLRKYSSAEAEPPLLNRLGSNAWEKLKERTKEEIFKMASELIGLYAERKTRPGMQYGADTPLQRELEAAFPFQETPDQLRTMEDVKKDMESTHPMDRLVCGDVGYGKTEIAVRAAFKAVCAGKQVAVLVPTTILAQQHYQTFTERMANMPVRVDVLSRFRNAAAQRQVVSDVNQGKVDILVGTHRILSKDLRFADLGLLVVDEEQRFGVKHKEQIKQIKRMVDVIALTATPIPRTLHMSLMGSRDMSVINTPPQDRLPIHTEIIAFDEDRITQAIAREVQRGGQVYFVHNRIRSIFRLSEYLEELLPQVRFAVAHGQMPPRKLETIMHDFLERKYDCLVSTMIIESGIDIPSVNTILVNRADMLGLGQLYQIRGRVGRSKERAYAYLMVPKGKRLTKKSRLRLRAIEEFADLGSGFNIAMRDMEIRGAGNIIGAQQHGFIAAVGFDLYCRLLDEAVRELKGEVADTGIEPDIKISVTAYIPDEYIPDTDLKMEFYQRLAEAQRLVDLLSIVEEMQDRFGRMPYQAQSLLSIMEIKIMASQLGLEGVQLEKSRLRLIFPEQKGISPTDIQQLVHKSSVELEFDVGERLTVETFIRATDEQERLAKAKEIIQEML